MEDICVSACRCVFITEGDSGGHVLRETTSRGPCELVCLVVVVYYCSTKYKAVRVGVGGSWRTCFMRYDEPRLVWTSLTTTH